MRIFFTVTPEEYDKIRQEAGAVALSKYARSKFFSVKVDLIKDEILKQWVNIIDETGLSETMLKNLLAQAKSNGSKPSSVFYRKFT